jgi:hypothetical protein
MKAQCLRVILLVLPVLAGCAARPEIPRDRYGLATQHDVYLIHHTAKNAFRIEQKGDAAMPMIIGVAAAAVPMMRSYESARLQQKLDLKDPAPYLKARLAEVLRRELELTNLQVLPDASNLTVRALTDERSVEESLAPSTRQRPPGGGARAASQTPSLSGTFNEKYSIGTVIEVVTEHWGIDDYRIKYYASARLVNLGESKVLLSTHCSWVLLDPINTKKLFAETTGTGSSTPGMPGQVTGGGNYGGNYAERAEGLLYAQNGALLKASLREAAELCANRIVTRLLGPAQRKRPQDPGSARAETPAEAAESGSSGSQSVLEDELTNCVSNGVRTWTYRSKCDP